MNRRPISTSDILNRSQHAGKNYPPPTVVSSPTDPYQNFGGNAGIFQVEMPATVGGSLQFIPVYAVRIYDALFTAKGTPVAAEVVTVSKVTPAGVTTALFTITLAGGAGEIARPTSLANLFTDMTLAQGDAIKISSVSGVTGGYQLIVKFYNV